MMFDPEAWARLEGTPVYRLCGGPLVRRIWKERDSHLGKGPS